MSLPASAATTKNVSVENRLPFSVCMKGYKFVCGTEGCKLPAAATLDVILPHLVACQWAKSEQRQADAAFYGQVPDFCPAFQCSFEVNDRQELVAHWEAEHLGSRKCQHASEQGDKKCSASHPRRSDMLSHLTSVHRLNLWESPDYKMCTSCELM